MDQKLSEEDRMPQILGVLFDMSRKICLLMGISVQM